MLLCMIVVVRLNGVVFGAPQHNVLLLISDNHNQNDCGCYGIRKN